MARDRRPQRSDLDVEIPMGFAQVGLTLARSIATVALVLFLTPESNAQTVDVSGRYQCAQAKMRGKVLPCKAAPLILKNDGRFELRGWEGSYLGSGWSFRIPWSKRARRLSRDIKSCCATTESTAWWK